MAGRSAGHFFVLIQGYTYFPYTSRLTTHEGFAGIQYRASSICFAMSHEL